MHAKKLTLLILALLALAVMLTACGRKTIVVNDYLSLELSGFDQLGIGKGRLDWEQMVKDNMDVFGLKSTDDPEMLSVLLRLDKALRGELDQKYNLSNGDQVTYHWDTSKLDVLEEKYNAKFILEDKTFTVSGLKPFS